MYMYMYMTTCIYNYTCILSQGQGSDKSDRGLLNNVAYKYALTDPISKTIDLTTSNDCNGTCSICYVQDVSLHQEYKTRYIPQGFFGSKKALLFPEVYNN